MKKPYLDNLRWSVIVLVLVFHVVSIFSACKAPMSYNAPGIPALDAVGYLIYPWFMSCLFVVSGICARTALQKRTGREFMRERAWRLLVPFAAYMVLVGPFAAQLAFRTQGTEQQLAALPGFVLALIKILNGMGPSWFLPQLFLVSVLLLLVRKLDGKQRLLAAGARCRMPALLLLYVPALGCAQVLYVAYTFRNALYLFLFLLGYYVFSQDAVQATLQKWCVPLLGCAAVLGVAQTYTSWGIAYQWVVNDWLVMLYTWMMLLAVFGCAGRWFNRTNRFTQYMTARSFGLYLFHYVPMVYAAYALTAYTSLPKALIYVLVLGISAAVALVLTELVRRIPVLNVLFGLKKQRTKQKIAR